MVANEEMILEIIKMKINKIRFMTTPPLMMDIRVFIVHVND